MATVDSRRERKKRDTRSRIQHAALELFVARGYRQTTIAAIAERADVAARTVTVHFPAKEDLLFADDPFTADHLARRLAARGPEESTLDAVRDWMATTMRQLDVDADQGGVWRHRALRSRLLIDDDELRGRARAGYRDLEELVAAGIGRDLGLAGDALVPRLAATTIVTGLREVYATHEARAVTAPTTRDLLPLVDRVLDFARAGIVAAIEP